MYDQDRCIFVVHLSFLEAFKDDSRHNMIDIDFKSRPYTLYIVHYYLSPPTAKQNFAFEEQWRYGLIWSPLQTRLFDHLNSQLQKKEWKNNVLSWEGMKRLPKSIEYTVTKFEMKLDLWFPQFMGEAQTLFKVWLWAVQSEKVPFLTCILVMIVQVLCCRRFLTDRFISYTTYCN